MKTKVFLPCWFAAFGLTVLAVQINRAVTQPDVVATRTVEGCTKFEVYGGKFLYYVTDKDGNRGEVYDGGKVAYHFTDRDGKRGYMAAWPTSGNDPHYHWQIRGSLTVVADATDETMRLEETVIRRQNCLGGDINHPASIVCVDLVVHINPKGGCPVKGDWPRVWYTQRVAELDARIAAHKEHPTKE